VGRAPGETGVPGLPGYPPDWRCPEGRRPDQGAEDGRPDLLGAERWTCAVAIATAVTTRALPWLRVNWSLLGAGSLLALLVRAAIAGGALAIRQAVDARVFLGARRAACGSRSRFAPRSGRPRGVFAPAGLSLTRGGATTEPIQRPFTVRD